MNVKQQSACVVVNQIMVNRFAFLFNCIPIGRASDSVMDAKFIKLIRLFSWFGLDICCLGYSGLKWWFTFH